MAKTKITQSQMDAIGMYDLGFKSKPKRHFVPFIGEIDLHESTTLQDVLQLVYEAGEENGIKEGKELKIKEFKKVLDIEID